MLPTATSPLIKRWYYLVKSISSFMAAPPGPIMEPDSSLEIRNLIEMRFLALCLGNARELDREEFVDVDILSICCFEDLATL